MPKTRIKILEKNNGQQIFVPQVYDPLGIGLWLMTIVLFPLILLTCIALKEWILRRWNDIGGSFQTLEEAKAYIDDFLNKKREEEEKNKKKIEEEEGNRIRKRTYFKHP